MSKPFVPAAEKSLDSPPSPAAKQLGEIDDLSRYARRPLGFYLRYVRLRPFLHGAILLAGFAAAICAVGTQYGLKFLVDALSRRAPRRPRPGSPSAC